MIKLINRYRTIPVATRASIWYTICSFLQKGIVLLVTPIFTRLMSVTEYGIYTVYQSWYSIIIIFASLNLYCSVYNNILTNYPDERDSSTSAVLGLGSVLTLIFVFFYIIRPSFWASLMGLPVILLSVMLIQIFFEPALNFWMARRRYEFKYRSVVIVCLFDTVFSTILSFFVVLNVNEKGIARVLVYALCQGGIGIFFYFFHFTKSKKFFSKKVWKYALKFNIPLIPHYLSYTVLCQADRIMINNMVGTAEAAMYSIAYNISMLMQIVTQAIANSLGPYTYQSIKARNYKDLRKVSSILNITIAICCCIVMLFSPEILKIFASSEYYDAVDVMPAVVASTYFFFLYPLFSTVEFYFEKTQYVMWASVIGAVLNIVLNYLFIPIWGYYVAGFTTLVCYMLFSLAHYYFYRKILKEKQKEMEDIYNLKIIIFSSVLVIMFCMFSIFVYQYIYIRYGLIVLLIIFIITKREALINILKKLRSKS